MPFFGLPPIRFASRLGAELLRLFDTALGRDAEEILAVFDALPNTEARRAILRTLRSSVDWSGQVITMLDRAYLAEGMPTLIIWGRRDAIIPLGHGRLTHAAMPGSGLEIFDEAGHFPHHTDPARFVRVPARVHRSAPRRPPSTRSGAGVDARAGRGRASWTTARTLRSPSGARSTVRPTRHRRPRGRRLRPVPSRVRSVQDELGAAVGRHQPLGGLVRHRGVPDLRRAPEYGGVPRSPRPGRPPGRWR